jgi:hypothetical protein
MTNGHNPININFNCNFNLICYPFNIILCQVLTILSINVCYYNSITIWTQYKFILNKCHNSETDTKCSCTPEDGPCKGRNMKRSHQQR